MSDGTKWEKTRVRRTVLCQLSEQERAERAEAALGLEGEADMLRQLLAEEMERHRAVRKRLREQIAVKAGEARAVRMIWACGEEPREREVHEQLGPPPENGGQRTIIFTDPDTGEILEQRYATAEELQARLPGVDDEPGSELAGAELLDQATAALGGGLDGEALDAALDELGHDRAGLPEPLQWRKIPGHLIWVGTSGDDCYRISWEAEPSSVVVTASEPWRADRPEILRRKLGAAERDKPAAAVRALKVWCEERHRTRRARLRWPGDSGSGLLVDSGNCYQLTETGPGAWQATRIGGLDEGATELGVHTLEEAQAACQAHADGRRA